MISLSRADLENSSPAGKCTLSSDVEIEGWIQFQEELFIDGKVQGQINSDGVLMIGGERGHPWRDQSQICHGGWQSSRQHHG
jgi:cytoskeletal protein CcmA (bactofilin family)